MSRNLLVDETSPYLLQHAGNPVDWRPWGAEALAEAASQDRPILLSVGYSACHWCHVMAHESFEDSETAGLMNAHFVNIKVDREERPDIDAIYQNALALLGQPGGWPLTMFLTPDGRPFWGGTYFPPAAAFGRPGFKDVLAALASHYRDHPDQIANSVEALAASLAELSQAHAGRSIPLATNDEIAERLAKEFDRDLGGIRGAPKFPNTAVLDLLWRAQLRAADARIEDAGNPDPQTLQARARDAVLLTLERMSQGGIYDHLGGGFARYSTDSAWLVPHFEKMLYDNALLIDALTAAWQQTRRPLFAARVRETVEWMLREMVAEGGGFASTLDADSEGEEGRFYVWTASQIDALLGDDAAPFAAVYDITPTGNWEGKTILHRNHDGGAFDQATEDTLGRCRAVLLAARAERVRPGWDDKVLADWNGLAIAALANAGATFGEKRWGEAAARAFAFVAQTMVEDGRLKHSWRHGRARHAATLDDHACMARAALALFEATGESRYLEAAETWVDLLDSHYWDAEGGGYFFTPDDAEALIVRSKNAADSATPSGNGVAAEVLARLFYLTGKDHYRDRSEAVIAAFSGELTRNFFPLVTLLNASETLQRATQIVVVGRRDAPDTEALLGAAFMAPAATRVIAVVAPGDELPRSHPAHGKTQLDGRATAYVCVGPACSPPTTDAAALALAL